MRFKGCVAIVTGAGSGIGRAAALALAQEGASLALVGRDIKKLDDVIHEISLLAPSAAVISIAGDIAVPEVAQNVAVQTERKLGTPSVLINAAGIFEPAQLEADNALAVLDESFRINVRGTFLVLQAVTPLMIKGGKGAIVNIASLAGTWGLAGSSGYAASKGAVVAMSKSLAAELAPKGVRLNVIAPGNIATPMNAFVRTPEFAAVYEALRRITPSGRVYAEPEEVARLALFLASDDAPCLLGSVIVADDGLSAAVPFYL